MANSRKSCSAIGTESSFLANKVCQMNISEDNVPSAAVVASNHNNSFCYYCKSDGHLRSRCPKLVNITCYTCGRRGHTSRMCFSGNEQGVPGHQSGPSGIPDQGLYRSKNEKTFPSHQLLKKYSSSPARNSIPSFPSSTNKTDCSTNDIDFKNTSLNLETKTEGSVSPHTKIEESVKEETPILVGKHSLRSQDSTVTAI